jgi:hypothetical protein
MRSVHIWVFPIPSALPSVRTTSLCIDDAKWSCPRAQSPEFGRPGEPEKFIPPVTQETLAEMIGATRSRVGFFMNRFRRLGFIEYNGRIQVHKSLLNVVLLDRLPEHNSEKPLLVAGA